MKMKLLLSLLLSFCFSFTLIFTNNNNTFKTSQNKINQNNNGYDYIGNEIIKNFNQPIEFYKESLENGKGFLFLPSVYNTVIEYQLPANDLLLIQKEILETRLEFDVQITWWGVSQGPKILNNHLFQKLDFKSMQTLLNCGEFIWNSKVYGNLKINPLIKFSWNQDHNLVMEHQLNDFLVYDRIVGLSIFENNGLTKLDFKITNLKLIYKFPEIFNSIFNKQFFIPYFVNLESVSDIDDLISKIVLEDQELKTMNFNEYFEIPLLEANQKEELLNIKNDFFVNFSLKLKFKLKYQEEILEPLNEKTYLNLKFYQNINLEKLVLNKVIKIKQFEDPWEYFLNNNFYYKYFFEKYCDFKVEDNYLIINSKSDFKNINGSLKLFIEKEPEIILKKDLSELNLITDLGIFELQNENDVLSINQIFERWKNYNAPILDSEEIDFYSLLNVNDNELNKFWITAKDENKNFEGTILITLKIKYLDFVTKISLQKLDLIIDLGIINNIDSETILNKFLSLNKDKLKELNLDCYQIQINKNSNNAVIQAKENNIYYCNSVPITFSYEEKNNDNNDENTNLSLSNPKSFFGKYWWVFLMIIILFLIILIVIIVIYKRKKKES